jgi:hypothetical protein
MLGVLRRKTLIRLPSSLRHPVGRRIPSQVSSQVAGFLRCPVSSVRIIFRVFPDLLPRVTGSGFRRDPDLVRDRLVKVLSWRGKHTVFFGRIE